MIQIVTKIITPSPPSELVYIQVFDATDVTLMNLDVLANLLIRYISLDVENFFEMKYIKKTRVIFQVTNRAYINFTDIIQDTVLQVLSITKCTQGMPCDIPKFNLTCSLYLRSLICVHN